MGIKRDPAVRLCVTCGKLKSADRFPPGRRKCIACQQTPPRRPGTPHDSHAAVGARARDQALRRLGLEHLDAYRALYWAERRAIPNTVPADRARKQAVSRALRALERQHRSRYAELYQQQFKQAGSQPHPRRPGRPAGTPDRLTIAAEVASTWAAGWSRPPPARATREGSQTAGRTAGGPGTRRRPVCSRGAAVGGCPPARRRQADRGQLARPLAKRWERSVAQPWPQPPSRDSRQEAAGDRTGTPEGRQGSRF
jgi:hypothetical protein